MLELGAGEGVAALNQMHYRIHDSVARRKYKRVNWILNMLDQLLYLLLHMINILHWHLCGEPPKSVLGGTCLKGLERMVVRK